MQDILSTLALEGSFNTLLALLERTGLTDTLAKEGPFTLFASNDAAFERVKINEVAADREKLVALLSYHIVDGKHSSAEIGRDEHLLTNSGKSLTLHLDEGRQTIDNARYIRTDIECSNGIIHVIDNVFLPQMSGWYCGSCC
jgi:uncharacterized surface protein with fasciclin (FAS1) repeats